MSGEEVGGNQLMEEEFAPSQQTGRTGSTQLVHIN